MKIQYVDGKHNTIPIAKTEHARYEGSSYEGYNDYYLVVVFGYHVVNGKKADTPFYLSANNGIGAGNANATHGPHLLQVKVDEVRVITATADEHGKIAPAAGTITVPKGESKTFTITPDSGYHIKDVLVDGKSVGAVSTYTFENVVDNHTIHATFARKHTPTPSTPTVEIPDDDALGLNTTDHFAYIVGYGNGEVRPQNNITRAEVATIFFRLLTDDVRDENLTKTNRYSDVAATSWYNTAVSTLSSMGIITGYPDGTFRPNAAITRAEFAAIAARFDNDGDKTAAKFSDIATHWAKDEISIAYNNGWITGYPDGTFGPQRDITRAETMTLVNRVLNRQPETEDDLLPNMTVWTDNANPKAWYYLAVQEATNSHYYEFKTNSQYEKWTELRETRDWKAPEQ
ncbi:MAG: S-layer homology domain-containing protein [Oscillospiraceae bacterium]